MSEFLKNNAHVFIFIIVLCTIALLVITILTHVKSSRLAKSMLVSKFKLIDLNEKNTSDSAPLYTAIITNTSVSAVSISSIGFEHDGNFFNFRDECKRQLDSQNLELVILPRGIIKLRLDKAQLEKIIFSSAKSKRLKSIRVYIIGLGGEYLIAKAKVITKAMKLAYKEYYPFHEQEINQRFINLCERKILSGVKLGLNEKLRYKKLSKQPQSTAIAEAAAVDDGETTVKCEIENPVPENPSNDNAD